MDGMSQSNLATNQIEGGGINHPPRCRLVEPDAMRVARPVRRRLIGVIPAAHAPLVWENGGQSNPDVLSDTVLCSANEGRQGLTSTRVEAAVVQEGENPFQGARTIAALRHNRVEVS